VVLGLEVPPDYLLLLGVVLAAPLDIFLYRFEADLRNGLLARIRVGLALAMALARVLLCWGGQDLTLIAATYVAPPVLLNLIVAGLGRTLLRERSGTPAKLPGARLRAVQRHILRRALWGFGAVLILQLGLRLDQLLLAHLVGPRELGWYASAWKFLEQVTILATMANGILLPALSRRSQAETRALLQSIYFATLVASLLAAAVLGGAAGLIVDTAYGPAFGPAGEVLAILALAIPGITLSLTGTLYYSLTGADAQLMLRAAAGLAIALAASLLLIPRYGAVGAAWAVVISQTLLAFGVDGLSRATRANNVMKWQALAGLFSPENYRRLVSQARRPRAAIEEVKA
jgi:O-antigen/teichoic acid export membrane protein